MSCRHQPDAPRPGALQDAPAFSRKWRRFPSALPAACNDNHRPGRLRTALLAGSGIAGLLAGLLAVAASLI